MNENRSKNLDLPYDEYTRFDLDEMEDPECISEFRVKKLKQFCGPRHDVMKPDIIFRIRVVLIF